MIRNIIMKNFKCFTDSKISLKQMTILTGANAAGKSSVIQALLLSLETLNNNSINVSKALGISTGGPSSLVAQNRIELRDADFVIGIDTEVGATQIRYNIDKISLLKLNYNIEGTSILIKPYYLNAERVGPRISYSAGYDDDILHNGSNAAYLIDAADSEGRMVADALMFNSETSKFSINVEHWMNLILGDIRLSITTDPTKAISDVRYGNINTDEDVLPTMTGFGISYILSIVTAGLWCSTSENSVLIIENPEAHLHPYSQSQMGKFLQLVSTTGVQVIVETHSEHIVDGARIQAAYTTKTDDILIEYIENSKNGVQAKEISVDKNGELSEWPNNFFDQKAADLRTLYYLRKKNGSL